MEFDVLKSKKIVDGKIDLLSNFIQIDFENVIVDEWILVDVDTVMLLDLISFAMYGSDTHVDKIKKFNKIDNPLEIQIGQIIAIPNLQSFDANSRYITPVGMKMPRVRTTSVNSKSSQNQTPSRKAVPASNFIKNSNGNMIF